MFEKIPRFQSLLTRRLLISRNAFPINFYRIRIKKIQVYACSEKQKGNSKLREIASNRLFLLHTGFFWCNTRVFPISYEHLTHVGMLQSRYKQCKAKWLLSTWSDYARYFARSLFAISTTFQIKLTITDETPLISKETTRTSEQDICKYDTRFLRPLMLSKVHFPNE